MYIFITYGHLGMRGVQTKGLRLANYFIKCGHKVKFYDHDLDHSILIKAGVDYENWDLNALYPLDKITFPRETQAVIFFDLPTNHIGQLSLFLAAKDQHIPVVVIDNFYSPEQLSQKVFANIIKYCDLVVLNGLTTPSNVKIPSHIKIIGPFIRPPHPKAQINLWLSDIGVKSQEKIILGAGYNEEVLKELENLSKKINRKDVVILALGASKKTKRMNNIIYLPFLDDQQVNDLLSVACLAIYKFGFIQVVEALMNGIPVIMTGSMRGFKTEWLDKNVQDLIFEAKDIDQLKKLINEIIDQKGCFIQFQNRLKKINLADTKGLATATRSIEKIKRRKTNPIIKEIVIGFDDKKSLQKLSDFLANKPFALPIIFSIPSLRPSGQKTDPSLIWQYEPTPSDEILQWGCQLILRSSSHSFHSGAVLLPFFNILIDHFKKLLTQADRVSYCDNKIKSFIKPLLN